jgi:hypothetical protein
MKTKHYRLMAPVGDGSDLGGDRGDTFTPPTGAVAAAEPDADAVAAAEPDADAAAATEAAEAAAETPRDTTGKFVKKDKEDGEPLIPKSRFDAQLAKERDRAEAAERRAGELEKQAAQVTRNLDVDRAVADVAALRKEERKALLDGDEDAAAQISAQADRLNRQIAIAESGELTGQAKDQALEDMRFELTLERLEERYPTLAAGHEDYDQDLVDDILDKQRGLMQRERLSPSKALAKATEAVMSRQAPAPAGEKTGLAAAQTGEPRKAAAVAKNLDAAARQPGNLKEAGLDSDKAGQTKPTPSAGDMTYEEFEALPEATRAKMRGDFA